MNSFENLTPTKLRRAAEIKEKLQSLNNELNQIFGGLVPVTPKVGRAKRKMSPAAKAKLSAKLKASWARRKAAAPVAPKAGRAKAKWSPAAKAQLSAKLKAAWVKRKAAKQK